MVTVLHDHFFNIITDDPFPFFIILDMLPAGRFCEHKQSQAVTRIKKMLGLGIMGGTDRIHMKLFFQYSYIFHLHGCRHSIAYMRIALMAVNSTNLIFPAV
ncbi:hypothetical protein D3C76_1512980 [compost metagenome]